MDQKRADEIREYYKSQAGLDLDEISAFSKNTREKALQIARFVSDNIPHTNQKVQMSKRNALTLWEYSRKYPDGFNCCWHSILLSELLLSVRIKNRFITCLPEDQTDGDCHVVNIVWLPEEEKWAILDSDMYKYITNDACNPLSLEEMRQSIIEDRAFRIFNLNKTPVPESYNEYLQAYWRKNLYYFASHTTYGFDLERERNLEDKYLYLLPPDYILERKEGNIYTSNTGAFWD